MAGAGLCFLLNAVNLDLGRSVLIALLVLPYRRHLTKVEKQLRCLLVVTWPPLLQMSHLAAFFFFFPFTFDRIAWLIRGPTATAVKKRSGCATAGWEVGGEMRTAKCDTWPQWSGESGGFCQKWRSIRLKFCSLSQEIIALSICRLLTDLLLGISSSEARFTRLSANYVTLGSVWFHRYSFCLLIDVSNSS